MDDSLFRKPSGDWTDAELAAGVKVLRARLGEPEPRDELVWALRVLEAEQTARSTLYAAVEDALGLD